jgi:diaminopimelate decarboxylase
LHQHKFGIPVGRARTLYAEAARSRWLRVSGVSVHIGSQITNPSPFAEAMERVAELVRQLRGDKHRIEYIDAGGGLGISYEGSDSLSFPDRARRYADALTNPLRSLKVNLLLEPGRAILGPAGALITRVLYLKRNEGKRFVITDAAMSDLLRPALYKAYHEIVPVKLSSASRTQVYDVVGPICETGDFFARDRELPEPAEGDLLAILDAGAYGMVLASNYNTRPRAAEVLVDGNSAQLVRRRETVEDLLRPELP